MARKNSKTPLIATVSTAENVDLPEIVFNEAEALAALSSVDYAPVAVTTWTPPVVETVEEMSDEEIASALAEIEREEALEEARAETDEVESDEAPESEDEAPIANTDDFLITMNAVTNEDALSKARHVAKALDERAAFEKIKKPDNTTIQKTIESARKALATNPVSARILAAAAISEDFINRSVYDGSKYNVYAIGKFADAVLALNDGVIRNAINNACMRSLFKCRAAGVTFDMAVAKACASNKVKIDPTIKRHLVQHTVSEQTAPTQASSTMQALVTLGIVTASGSARNPIYTLTDSPITKRLEKLLAA